MPFIHYNANTKHIIKINDSIVIACFLFTLLELPKTYILCLLSQILIVIILCFLWLFVSDAPAVQGFNKVHAYLLTVKNYRW